MHVSLCEGIDWVGYVDWTVRDFHSYSTERGTTYNAYLIRDEQVALIDAVKEPFGNDLLANVSALVDPARVDWVICNHAEPDHAGVLPQVLAAMPNATLVCNKKCLLALNLHFDTSGWKIKVVEPGDVISLGRRTLEFINTPMAHWPESMFTYVRQDRVLFSMDAFGQHCATTERFDDENCIGTVLEEARTYYANILMPYGSSTAKAMASVTDLDIGMIATSHGVIWRSHIPQILDAYRRWTSGRPQPRVIILYDTMWESTAAMARAFEEGAAHPGVQVKVIHVRRNTLTTIAADVFDAARRGGRFGHAQRHHDAPAGRRVRLSPGAQADHEGSRRLWLLRLGPRLGRSHPGKPGNAQVGRVAGPHQVTLPAHAGDTGTVPGCGRAAGAEGAGDVRAACIEQTSPNLAENEYGRAGSRLRRG